MEKLNELEAPRSPGNGARHDFREIKAEWLRRFLPLKNCIPPAGTFLRVFRVLDPKQFEAMFRRWVGGIAGALEGSVAIDGKSLCGSADGATGPRSIW